MQVVLPALGVGHVDDSTLQPAEQVHALLAVRHTRIFHGDDRMIEHRVAAFKIQPVLAEVGFAFSVVPGDHPLNRSYKKRWCQGMWNPRP